MFKFKKVVEVEDVDCKVIDKKLELLKLLKSQLDAHIAEGRRLIEIIDLINEITE